MDSGSVGIGANTSISGWIGAALTFVLGTVGAQPSAENGADSDSAPTSDHPDSVRLPYHLLARSRAARARGQRRLANETLLREARGAADTAFALRRLVLAKLLHDRLATEAAVADAAGVTLGELLLLVSASLERCCELARRTAVRYS